MCPQQQHLQLLFKDSCIRFVPDNAKSHATTSVENGHQRTKRRRSEPLRGYTTPRRRRAALKRAQSDTSVSRWASEASSTSCSTKRDVLPSGAKHLSPMHHGTVRDVILTRPRRRRSIDDPTLLALFSHSLSSLDDIDDTKDGQSTTAFIAAALETLQFYENEMSALLKTS